MYINKKALTKGMDNGEGIMDRGDIIKVIYIDGKKPDGTEHISFKIGEFTKSSNSFFCMIVNSQEILIPSSRIIRIEKMKKVEIKKDGDDGKWK